MSRVWRMPTDGHQETQLSYEIDMMDSVHRGDAPTQVVNEKLLRPDWSLLRQGRWFLCHALQCTCSANFVNETQANGMLGCGYERPLSSEKIFLLRTAAAGGRFGGWERFNLRPLAQHHDPRIIIRKWTKFSWEQSGSCSSSRAQFKSCGSSIPE